MRKRYIVIFLFFYSFCFAQKQINPNLFGFRLSTSFVFFDVQDTTFSKKVSRMNPQVLSFPGGLGNFYHLNGPAYGVKLEEVEFYHKGSKPKIAKTLSKMSASKKHNRNYIYDFIDLVKRTDAKVIFNVNILTEKKEDYIKSLQLFRDYDIDLIGVELGGELSNSVYKHEIDGEKYIELAKKCANDIKSVFPEVRLAVVAAPVNVLKRHDSWNHLLANEDFYDAIVVHSYAKVTKGESRFGQMKNEKEEGKNKAEAFHIYKKRAIEFLELNYPKKISEYNVAFKNKPIWITEWNLQMSKITANTLLQGLFVDHYLLEVSTNKKLKTISLATFHNFAGRTLSGSMLMKKENKTHVLSTFTPMQMISKLYSTPDYILHKKQVQEDCFIYNFSDKRSNNKLTYIVNWSNNKVSYVLQDEMQLSCLMQEYFGRTLYSTTLNEQEKIFTKTQRLNGIIQIQLKPYSLTVLSANE